MKKKLLVGLISCGAAASALAQGTLIFEDALSTGSIYVGSYSVDPSNYARAGTYTVALLWASGNTLGVPQSQFTQIALFGAATGGATENGFFLDPNTVVTGAATAGGTVAVFEVQGWIGNYTSYAQAVAAHAYAGQTGEFLNGTGTTTAPASAPVDTTGWDGNLLIVPEPGTLALGALGAAALCYFRRRKQT